MFVISGFLAGLWSYLFLIGYAVIEALLFMWCFNYVAPQLVDWGLILPVMHIGFWFTFTCFILISLIGKLIQRIVPTFVEIDQSNENKN